MMSSVLCLLVLKNATRTNIQGDKSAGRAEGSDGCRSASCSGEQTLLSVPWEK